MEVFGANESFIVDIENEFGQIETADIKPDDIQSVFVEFEQAYGTSNAI
jgi:hypothetical protein